MDKTVEALLALMQDKKINANQLQIKCGLSNNAVTLWKKGFASPSKKTLVKIAEHFNIPLNYFYVDENQRALYNLPSDTAAINEAIHGDGTRLSDAELSDVLNYIEFIKSTRNERPRK